MVTKHIDPAHYRVTKGTRDGGSINLDEEAVYAPDGHRVTEAETQDFTAGRGGRPSLSGQQGQSPVFGVRLPQELRAQIDAAATEAGIPASEVVRQALDAWFTPQHRTQQPASTRH